MIIPSEEGHVLSMHYVVIFESDGIGLERLGRKRIGSLTKDDERSAGGEVDPSGPANSARHWVCHGWCSPSLLHRFPVPYKLSEPQCRLQPVRLPTSRVLAVF